MPSICLVLHKIIYAVFEILKIIDCILEQSEACPYINLLRIFQFWLNILVLPQNILMEKSRFSNLLPLFHPFTQWTVVKQLIYRSEYILNGFEVLRDWLLHKIDHKRYHHVGNEIHEVELFAASKQEFLPVVKFVTDLLLLFI